MAEPFSAALLRAAEDVAWERRVQILIGSLHEDPARAWVELGDCILWEAVTYGGWSADERSLMHLPGVQTLDEVRASGRYRFLTPDQLIAEVRDSKNYGPIVLHPLVGGMPVDEAWKSVQLLTDTVLPALS